MIVPLRPCLGVLAVVALALAMTWSTRGELGIYCPMTMTAALAAGVLALAACTLPRRAWQFPPVTGRSLIVAAGLFAAAHCGYRLLNPEDRTASWVKDVVEQTPPPARDPGQFDAVDFGTKAGVGLTALLVAAVVGLRRRARPRSPRRSWRPWPCSSAARQSSRRRCASRRCKSPTCGPSTSRQSAALG